MSLAARFYKPPREVNTYIYIYICNKFSDCKGVKCTVLRPPAPSPILLLLFCVYYTDLGTDRHRRWRSGGQLYLYFYLRCIHTRHTHVHNTSPGALVCVCVSVNIHRCRVRLYAVFQSRAQYRYARTCHTHRLRKTYQSPLLPTVLQNYKIAYIFVIYFKPYNLPNIINNIIVVVVARRMSSCSRQFTLGESFVYFCFIFVLFLFDIIGTYIK